MSETVFNDNLKINGSSTFNNLIVTGTTTMPGSISSIFTSTNSTNSTSNSLGSFVISGGIGISNTLDAISSINGGTFTSAGGIAVAKNAFVGTGIVIGTDTSPITSLASTQLFLAGNRSGTNVSGIGFQRSGSSTNSIGINNSNQMIFSSSTTSDIKFQMGQTDYTSVGTPKFIIGNSQVSIPTATDSNSITTGSFITSGGIGVSLNAYIGGNLNLSGTVTSGTWNGSVITVSYGGTGQSSLTTDAVLVGNGTGGVQSPSTITYSSSTLTIPKLISNDTTDSSSSLSGSIIISGGVGIAKNLYVGTNIFSTGNIGVGTTTANGNIQFSNSINNRKIVLREQTNDDHNFFGFGTVGSGLRYQVPSGGNDHVFYAGISSSTSIEIGRITRDGIGLFSIVQGSSSVSGNLIIRSTSNATKGQIYLDETTQSSSVTTGSLRVDGGVGIGKKLYVGDVLTVKNMATAGTSGIIAQFNNTLGVEKITIIDEGITIPGGIRSNVSILGLGLYSSSSGPLDFYTTSSDILRMRIWNGGDVYMTSTTDSNTSSTGSLVISGGIGVAKNITSSGGQIKLNNATSNLLYYSSNGSAAPSFTTRSTGTKIVLLDNISGSAVDYSIGIEASSMWNSVPTNTNTFKWYMGTEEKMNLSNNVLSLKKSGSNSLSLSTGSLFFGSTVVNSSYASITVGGTIGFNDNIILNNTNKLGLGILIPSHKLHLEGTVSNYSSGPHTMSTLVGDVYPLYQQLSWDHDNVNIAFDSYFDGTSWKSSSTTGNYAIQKSSGVLTFVASSAVSAGSSITWNTSYSIQNTGQVYIQNGIASTSTTSGALKVNGGVGISGSAYVAGDLQVQGHLKTSVISKITPIYLRGSGLNNLVSQVARLGNSELYFDSNIGLVLSIINSSTHAVISITAYAISTSGTASTNLSIALDNMDRQQIGLITTYSSFTGSINSALRASARRLGLYKLSETTTISTGYCAIFKGQGTADPNTNISNQVVEVITDSNATSDYALINAWLIDDSISCGVLPSVLVNPNPTAVIPAVYVNNNGYVGIGTVAPESALQVVGNRATLPSTAGIHMGQGTGSDYAIEICAGNNTSLSYIDFTYPTADAPGRIFYNHSTNSMGFFTNSANKLTIDSTGITSFSATTATTSNITGSILSSGGIGISNTTDASSSINGGTFTTSGGAAIAKQLYIGTNLSVAGNSSIGTVTSGTWNGSVISVPYGGTGQSTLTSNAVLVGNGTGGVQSPSTITYSSSTLNVPKIISNDLTDSTSTIVGSTVISGGLAVAKNSYFGGKMHVNYAGFSGGDGAIRISPNINGAESSISFHQNILEGGSSWFIGQNTGSIGSNIFGILNSTFGNTITINSSGQVSYYATTATTSNITGSILSSGGIGISNTTDSISSINGGTFTTAGGAAIAKQLYIGTNLSVAGNSSIGTVTSGTWNGSVISVPYGGTGQSTLTSNAVLVGNGTGGVQSPSTITYSSSTLNVPKIISNDPTSSSSNSTGSILVSGSIAISNTTDSSSSTNGGTITSAGGMAIAKKLFVGGTLSVGNTIIMNNTRITNLAEPVSASDAVTKNYADLAIQGLSSKASVSVATTVSGTLASSFQNGSIVDSVTIATGNRILIKDQASGIENGIYIVNVSGSPTRSSDLSSGTSASGVYVFIEQGTVNDNSGWVCASDPGSDVVGTNSLLFTQFSGAGSISAGTGLTKIGNILSVNASQTQISSVGTLTAGTWNASNISVPYGGTGVSTLNLNSVLLGNGTSGIQSPSDITYSSNTLNLPKISLTDITASTSTTTGSVIISGGIGIAKNIITGGYIFANFTGQNTGDGVISVSPNTNGSVASLTFYQNISNSGASWQIGHNTSSAGSNVFGIYSSTFAGNVLTANSSGQINIKAGTGTSLIISSITDSTSNTSGSVTLAGGIGILKNAYIGGNLNVSGVINNSSLTISQIVATDASKNLVSISVTGSGSVVLAISPILITPNIGAASGTSLQLSSLTASQIVATDASKNLVSKAITGTGSVVLNSFPVINGAKISFNGGSISTTNGIYWFDVSSASWATYWTDSGTTRNLLGGSAPAGTGFTSYAIRNRVTSFLGNGGEGFIWENDLNVCLFSVRGSDGLAYFAGNVGIGSTTAASVPLEVTGTIKGTNLNITSLTASQIVATDASKNLVSISVTGSGSVVLATSASLITPNIGAASGTSLQLSGLTASQIVATDASKNLVSISVTGSGSVVLATSPILITPNIGVASGTSLQLSGTSSIINSSYNGGSRASGLTIGLNAGNYTANTDPGDPNRNLTLANNSTTGHVTLTMRNINVTPFIDIIYDPITIGLYYQFSSLVTPLVIKPSSIISSVPISITNTTASTSSITGSLLLSGGIGVSNTTDASSSTNGGAVTIAGGIGILKNAYIGGNLNVSGVINNSSLTASQIVATDSSKNLVSIATTGSGSAVLSVSPTFTGTITASSITNSGLLTCTTSKIGVHNTSEVPGNGIYWWSLSLTPYSTYFAQSGVGKSIATGSACTGVGFSGYAIRNRNDSSSNNGFIWENSSELLLHSIRTSDGLAYFAGNVGIGSNTVASVPLEVSGTIKGTNLNITSLTASQIVATDSSKNLVSIATTGSGSAVLSVSPTFTGTITASSITNSGLLTCTTSKIGVHNTSEVPGNGIYWYSLSSTPYSTYFAQSGVGKSIAAGSACTGVGFSGYAIRNRNDNSSNNGFIWENSSELLLHSIRASDGLAYFAGNVGIGSNTVASVPLEVSGTIKGTNLNITSLTASQIVATDASKNLVSLTTTGSGSVVLANSPIFTGTPQFGQQIGLFNTNPTETSIIYLNSIGNWSVGMLNGIGTSFGWYFGGGSIVMQVSPSGSLKMNGGITSATAYYLSLYGTPSLYTFDGNIRYTTGTVTASGNMYVYFNFPNNTNNNFSPIITGVVKYGVPVNGIYMIKFSFSNSDATAAIRPFISKNSTNTNDLNSGGENLLALSYSGENTISAVTSMTTSDYISFGYFFNTGTTTPTSRCTANIYCMQRTS